MSSSGWQSAKIDEVAEAIFSGGTPNTGKGEYWNGVYNWLSSGETRNVYITQTEKTITSEGINNSSTRLALKDDVVIASAGQGYTRGQVSYCMIDTYINQSIIAIRTKKDKLMSKYLFFNLRNRYQELRQISDGNSIRGSITTKHIKALDIIVPPLPEQKAIAATLSCLDDKIELNNRINKTLEEMAQTIFKSWFIDFEPFQDGEFEDSELGLIPKGWRVGILSDIANITMGQSPSGSSYNEVGDGRVFYQGRAEFGFRFPTRRLYTTEPKRMASKGDVLMSVRAPVGDLNVAIEPCCIGRGLAAIQSKNGHSSFILYTMFALQKQLNIFNGEGTVFGSINKDSLNTCQWPFKNPHFWPLENRHFRSRKVVN